MSVMQANRVKVPSSARDHYKDELASIEQALWAAMDVSSAAGGIKTSTRYIRATQLFTRLVVGTYSFVRPPGNTITRDLNAFWDWPTAACVARNSTETYHIFYYLVDPSLTEEDVELRVNLMHLHLNSGKYRLYKKGHAAPAGIGHV